MLVLQRYQDLAGSVAGYQGNGARRLGAHDAIIDRAIGLGTGHVRQRCRRGVEVPASESRAARRDRKGVDALTEGPAVGGQVVVNQAASGGARTATASP